MSATQKLALERTSVFRSVELEHISKQKPIRINHQPLGLALGLSDSGIYHLVDEVKLILGVASVVEELA